MNVWYVTALLTGLAGSLHCVGMCGPLAMALPIGRLPQYQRIPAILVYHLGRISAYVLLGLVVGLAGKGLWLVGLQHPVSIGAGILLLGWLLTQKKYPHLVRSSPLLRGLTAPLTRLLTQPTFPNFGVAGFLNGFLPCGFVYVAMTGALAQQTAWEGAAYMSLFGLGTLPALLAVRFVPTLFPVRVRQRFQAALPILTIVLALLLIGRGIRAYEWPLLGENKEVPICHGIPGK